MPLFCHYERLTINEPKLIKLKFNSSPNTPNYVNWKVDGKKLEEIITILKQIPAGKRNYDPITNIWTIPAAHLVIIDMLLSQQDIFKLKGQLPQNYIIEHLSLDDYFYPPEVKEETWAERLRRTKVVKEETPEEFFKYSAPASINTLGPGELQDKLTLLIKPFVQFELEDRESFMRGYKIAARRLHPDLGGDSAKMSELNSLWMQYKEVMK